jgi:hypothetical protein
MLCRQSLVVGGHPNNNEDPLDAICTVLWCTKDECYIVFQPYNNMNPRPVNFANASQCCCPSGESGRVVDPCQISVVVEAANKVLHAGQVG